MVNGAGRCLAGKCREATDGGFSPPMPLSHSELAGARLNLRNVLCRQLKIFWCRARMFRRKRGVSRWQSDAKVLRHGLISAQRWRIPRLFSAESRLLDFMEALKVTEQRKGNLWCYGVA